MSRLLIGYVLRAAVRDRIVIALLLALLGGTCLAIFLGSSAVIEGAQSGAVFIASSLRIVGVLGLVLFVVFHVRRSFENKDVEFLLSRPITRPQFLFSFAAAFSIMALIMALAEGICLSAVMPEHFMPGTMLWIASIAVENMIMVTVALFFAMVLSSAVAGAMASLGLYALARMMGEILGIIDSHVSEFPGVKFLSMIMQVISSVTPRLDLMGQTSWLIYGPDNTVSYPFLVMQGVTFVALVLAASMVDLLRRKF